MKYTYDYYSSHSSIGDQEVSTAISRLFRMYNCDYSIPIVTLFMGELRKECEKIPELDDMLCARLPDKYDCIKKTVNVCSRKTMIKYELMYG